MYPLCAPEIEFSELPEPLRRLQALSLGKAGDIKLFFQALCDQFGFGDMKGFKGSTIKSRLPKYDELQLDNRDLETGTIYTGPYAGYSSVELKEILDEDYLYPQRKHYGMFESVSESRTSSIFSGELIHYRELDERLKLPPGTSKKYLKEVAKRYFLEVSQEWENSVRFALREEFDPWRS